MRRQSNSTLTEFPSVNDGAGSACDEDLIRGTGGAENFSARQHLVDHSGNGSVRMDVADAETQVGESPSHVTIEQGRDEALVLLYREKGTAVRGRDGSDGGLQLLHRLHRRL